MRRGWCKYCSYSQDMGCPRYPSHFSVNNTRHCWVPNGVLAIWDEVGDNIL